jgi:hypothetical protein
MPSSQSTDVKSTDLATTQSQLACAIWLANYKRVPVPPEVKMSRKAWWRWMNVTITEIDKQDAHAAHYDFDLIVDVDNPASVVGALKYITEADKKDEIDEAIRLIVFAKCHPDEAQDQLELSDRKMKIVLQRISDEYTEFEIDWGPG